MARQQHALLTPDLTAIFDIPQGRAAPTWHYNGHWFQPEGKGTGIVTRVIPPPPTDVRECRLARLLFEKSNPSDGLAERIEALMQVATPLLDLVIAGPFRDYTLHNPAHAKKLVHLAEHIMPGRTADVLSPVELALIIASCYLHDLGMALTADERQRVLQSPEFLDSLRLWPTVSQELEATRLQALSASSGDRLRLETRLYQLQEAALASHLRNIHATRDRYLDLIHLLKESSSRKDLFEVRGVSYENELIDICASHNLDVGVLLESKSTYEDRFPRDLLVSGYVVNVQFCAALLRLVDILDFDRERTPRIIFESLGIGDSDIPGATVSLREWNKHLAVHTISLSGNEMVVSADSSHPAIERSVRDFCVTIEREIRDTVSVLRRNPTEIETTYRIDLPLTVRPQVRSFGYVYRDFAFRLNESSISKILMGEGLYTNRAAALRELLQNSIDACRVRALLGREARYEPSIKLNYVEDSRGRFWIEVIDNGIGMDEFVLSNYFFRVGDSYYASADFARMLHNRTFTPISRFGIGVLSVFMVGDVVEIATRNVNSPRGDTVHRTARIEGRFGLAFVTEDPAGPEGTRVRVRLAFEKRATALLFLSQAAVYLRDTIRRPAVPIVISLPTASFTIEPATFIKLKDGKLADLVARKIEPIVLDIERWSQLMIGRVILFFHVRPDGLLSRSDGISKRILANQELSQYVSDYQGNRLTVNGVSMALSKLSRVIGTTAEPFVSAIDVEVPGTEDISYDVARNKVVGSGIHVIRRELRSAILKGMKALNITARLDQHTLSAIYSSPASGIKNSASTTGPGSMPGAPVVDPEVLAAVREQLPSQPWPVGMHHVIADSLGISPNLVFRAIGALIASGQVTKGYSSRLDKPASSTE